MTKLQNLVSQEELKIPCRHYWIIDPPDGDTSLGYCKHCGEGKEFTNVLPRYDLIKGVNSLPLSDKDDLTRENSDEE